MIQKTAIILSVILILPAIGTAQPVGDTNEVNPGLLPGNPFYTLEKFVETIEVKAASIVGGSDMRSKALANNAEERLAEAEKLADRNESKKAAKLVEKYSQTMNKSLEFAGKRKNPKLQEKLQNITSKNVETLQKVKDKVPDTARRSIQKAIENSERIEKGDPENIGKPPENSNRSITPQKEDRGATKRQKEDLELPKENKTVPGISEDPEEQLRGNERTGVRINESNTKKPLTPKNRTESDSTSGAVNKTKIQESIDRGNEDNLSTEKQESGTSDSKSGSNQTGNIVR